MKPCGPGLAIDATARRNQHRNRGPAEIHQRQDQDGEHRHLDFLRLDFLADVFRRTTDHQAGDENRENDEQQHAVHARADAADDDLAELDVDQRDHAAERRKGVMHGVDGSAGRGGRDHRKQRRGHNAEADFFAFHVAAGEAERIESVVAMRLGPVANDDAGDEQDAHHRENGPALALVADHPTEHVGQRRADREDRNDLHEVGKCRRVLEGMRSIGVEETAAVGAEHLDGDLRGNGPHRDRLFAAFKRGGFDIGPERLGHALPNQEKRIDDADRQQDVERATGDIDPEIADRAHRRARKPTD